MTRYHAAWGASLALLLAVAAPAQDVIRLKTGATLEGAVIEETEDAVTLQFPGGTMKLARSEIADIEVGVQPEEAAARRALLTLSRFADYDSWSFLYRDGRRVGYRTVSMRREAREGLPGYALLDRLVFVARPGAMADADVSITEFVDAELRPVSFECRISSGESSRSISGRRQGSSLVLKEDARGSIQESTALLRPEVRFPRMLLHQLASEPPPEGGYPEFCVFRPREGTFGRLLLDRRLERVSVRGRVQDVLVLRRARRGRTLETWMDMSGHVIREEIGSPHLVSLCVPADEVRAFIKGEDVGSADEDLGLEFVSEPVGLRLLRPDLSWEIAPATASHGVVSFLRPGLRATIDVLDVGGLPQDATEEGVVLDLLARMNRDCRELDVDGPITGRMGDQKCLRFVATCLRRDTRIRTLGAVLIHGRRALVLLCAAPEDRYGEALPAFRETLDSVRLLQPDVPATASPFTAAEEEISR